MNSREVVVHMKQSDHRNVVIELLTEGICEPGKPAHVHPHVEILTLHVRSTDVRVVGSADDVNTLGAQTLRRAVALLPFRIVAVYLHQVRVVNSLRKRIRDSHQIHLMAIRGQLDSIRQTAFNVLKERRRTPGIPPSNHPRNYELGLRFNRGERPNVSARPCFRLGSGDILLLAPNKRPYFIDLNALGGNVADNAVLVFSTGRANTHQEPKDSAFGDSRHANGGPNGATFDKRRDDRYFLRRADYVCHNRSEE